MSGTGPVWFDILPRIVGMGEASGNIVRESVKAGEQSGKGFADAFAQMVTGSTGEVTGAAEAQIKSLQAVLEKSSMQIAAAKDKVAAASGRVLVAETKEAEARAKYAAESSQVVAASVRTEEAKRREAAASAAVTAAVADETAAQEALATAQTRVAETSVTSGAKLGKAAGLMTAGYVVAIGAAVNAAGDFEQTQERLVTTAGESRDNLDMVSEGILNMAGQVGYSAGEMSKGMYTIESAGYHGADGLKVMQAAAQGARAEGADLTEVTDAVTTALHDYHLEADQSGLITSKMVTAVGEGKTTFGEFASSLSSVQPLAGAAGISIDDLYGSLAAMTASGMSADQATQNMADAIRHLMSPTQTMTTELAQLGINSADLSANLGKNGLAGSMQEISEAILKQMDPSGKALLGTFNESKQATEAATKMFQNLSPEVQKVAAQYRDGSITSKQWTSAIRGMTQENKTQAGQWATTQAKTESFNNALKSGSTDAQTFTQALYKATGDSASLGVALMLTGENAEKTNDNIANVANTTTEADGSVKGWHDTQETFNQKLNEFKDGLGAIGIKIGTDFLPAVSDLMGGLVSVGTWLTDNKWALDAIVISIGAIATGFVAWKIASGVMAVINISTLAASAAMGMFAVAEEGATVAADELAVAMAATGFSEIVIGITAIIVGLAALVAGVMYAYNHWAWFHDSVQAVWETMKSFGSWVATTASNIWEKLTHAFGNVEHAMGNVGHAFGNVGHAFENVGHAIGNVLNFIDKLIRVVTAVILTVLIAPIVIALHLMGDTWNWLYEHAVKPVIDLIKLEIQALGVVVRWINDEIFQPVLHAIGDIWNWIWAAIIQPVIDLIKLEIQGLGIVVRWLNDEIFQPVIHAIGDIWNWIWDHVISPVIESIKSGIQSWGDKMNWIHEHVIQPVSDGIHTAMSSISDAFKNTVDWIEKQWGRVEGIVKTPAKFIIDTVYNQGIAPVWNGIAGVFGLGDIKTVDVSNWAGGGIYSGPGIIPGYAPGQDTVNAKLSPGESVLTPEATRLLGPEFILGINGMSGRPGGNITNGMPIHASGGFFGDIGNAVSGVWSDLKDIGSVMVKILKDPAAALKDLFSNATGQAEGSPGDPSLWRTALVDVPGKFVDSAIDKVKSWVTGHSGSGSKGFGIPYVGSPDLDAWIMAAIVDTGVDPDHWSPGLHTLIGRESGGNPNAINLTDSNAQAGYPSQGLMQTIPQTFEAYRDPGLPDNITDPVANIVAGINYIKATYGDISNVQQADANAAPMGYAGGVVNYGLYDGGGTIVPGTTLVQNDTGQNEYTLDAGATQALKTIVAAITGSSQGISDQVSFSPPSMQAPGTQAVVDSGGAATITKPRTLDDVNNEYAGKFAQFFQDNAKDIFGSAAAGFGGLFIKDYHDNTGRNGLENARNIVREMNAHAGSGSR
ncbi:phage tail tape measure protein [Rhodococcus sp. 5A-K4]|uniref:phage tail tape measure protein n=1 Tax=Rhodococcus sp. 5A-K4 TaxID=3384442 RepID=UPI0038D49864